MPKKKPAIADENEQIAEVIDQQASKDLGVKVEDGNIVEENPIEEKAKELPKEEPVKEEEKMPFDPEKFAEETANKVKDKLAEEENKKIEEAKQAELKAKMEDEMIPIFEREGRNPVDYSEVVRESNRIAELKFEKMLLERENKAKQEQEEISKIKEAELARSKQFEADFNKMIDEELDELRTSEKLPKIADANDPLDEGVKATKELFRTMKEVNEKRVKEGQTPITSVSRIFNNYYKPTPSQPAGADAPVSGGRGVVDKGESDDGVMPYQKMHASSWLDFFRKK